MKYVLTNYYLYVNISIMFQLVCLSSITEHDLFIMIYVIINMKFDVCSVFLFIIDFNIGTGVIHVSTFYH